MNTSIKSTVYVIIGICLAVIFGFNIISSDRNTLAQAYKYVLAISCIISIIKPRTGVFLLLFQTAFLDLFKRFLIVFGNVYMNDLYVILGIAPLTMLCIMVGTFIKRTSNKIEPRPGDFKRLVIVVVLFLVLTAFTLLSSTTADSQTGFAGIANAGAYVTLIYVIPLLFRTREDLRGLLKTFILIYIPVAIYGIIQAKQGLQSWELEYLESGLTQEVRILYEQEALRVFSTMNGAATLSIYASVLGVGGLLFMAARNQNLGINGRFKRLALFMLLIICAYYTVSRGGWVCGITVGIMWGVYRNKTLTWAAYATAILSFTAVIVYSEDLMETTILADLEYDMTSSLDTGDSVNERALTTGTLNGRLESLAQLHDSEMWTPFGLKIADKEHVGDSFRVHDILTDTLMRIGYIPITLLLIGAVFFLIKAHMLSWNQGDIHTRRMAYWLYAMLFGVFVGSIANPAQLRTFPVNILFFLLLGVTISLLINIDNNQKQTIEEK
ncbi:MAG: hypothetical protein ACSHX6_03650 [Akkermansiaceae bacterium]